MFAAIMVTVLIVWMVYGVMQSNTAVPQEECTAHEWQDDLTMPGQLKCNKCNLTCPRFNKVVFKNKIR